MRLLPVDLCLISLQFSLLTSSLSRPWSAQKHSIWARTWWCGDGGETLPAARRDMRVFMTYISTCQDGSEASAHKQQKHEGLFIHENLTLGVCRYSCNYCIPFIKPKCVSILHIKWVRLNIIDSVLFTKSYPSGQSSEVKYELFAELCLNSQAPDFRMFSVYNMFLVMQSYFPVFDT